MHVRVLTQISLVLLYILGLLVSWLSIGGVSLQNSVVLFTSLVAVSGGVYAFMTYGFSGKRAMTILALTVGLSCWFVGEALWNYYEALGIMPFPSIADLFYLVAYPFLFIGLINEIRSAQIDWKKFSRSLLFLLGLTTILLSSIVLYFGVFLSYHASQPLLNNVIAMGYGIADLLLIIVTMLILVLVWEFRGGQLARSWIALFCGFVAMLIADILFAMFTNQYESHVGFYKSIIDSFFMLSYVLFAYGLFDFAFSLEDITHKFTSKHKK
jgi:hypothetical protein